MDLKNLAEPFPASDVEWKPANFASKSANMLVLPYVTARGVQDRLDSVCGPENWKVSYDHLEGGVVARLSIRIERGENEVYWVEKCDGAEGSTIESFKGAMSGAIKRAAVVWGVGRYLYSLGDTWAKRYTGTARPGPEYTSRGGITFLTPRYEEVMRKAGLRAPGAPERHGPPARTREPKETPAAPESTLPPIDPELCITASQLVLIGTLRTELKVSDKAYYGILLKDYDVKSAKDLQKDAASHLIERMKKRQAAKHEQEAVETFGDEPPRILKLRETALGYCLRLKKWNQKTANGEPIDYRSYGIDFDDITELEKFLPHIEDEKEIEGIIQRLDTLFAGETF